MNHPQGFTLTELMIVVAFFAIIAAIAIPNPTQPSRTANEAATVGSLRTIASVQQQFRQTDYDADGFLEYATSFAELSTVGLIDNVLGAGTRSGYGFAMVAGTYGWQASATPVSSYNGARNFIICTDGVVRFSYSGAANCASEAIE